MPAVWLEQVTCPLWALFSLLYKMGRIMNLLTGGSDSGVCGLGGCYNCGSDGVLGEDVNAHLFPAAPGPHRVALS